MTEAERLALDRRYEELINNPRYVKQPVAVVSLPVSAADAEVIRAAPESVRVSARRRDGVTMLMRPAANPNHVTVRVDQVREVDAFGRPVWDRPGVQHEYNPVDRL